MGQESAGSGLKIEWLPLASANRFEQLDYIAQDNPLAAIDQDERIEHQFIRRAAHQRRQPCEHGGIVPSPAAAGLRIHNHAAPQCSAGRRRAQDEMIASHHNRWALKAQLHPAHAARRDGFGTQHARTRRNLARPRKEINARIVLKGTVRIGQQTHLRIQQQCGLQ